MHHEGYRPRSVRSAYGSWLGFVKAMGDLSEIQQAALSGLSGEFLSALETTPMTRSYKMLVLLGMLHPGRLPGEIQTGELCEEVARLARRSGAIQRDLGVAPDDHAALERKLRNDPIAALIGGKGTGGTPYFDFRDDLFRTTFQVAPSHREAFAELAQEIVDWRLAEYMDRAGAGEPGEEGAGAFVCNVSHSGVRPLLFLPPREKHPQIPSGWTPVEVDGEPYEANFVKVAVNVMRPAGRRENALPDLMQRWFGPDAGQPGTSHRVRFEPGEAGLRLLPLPRGESAGGLEVGRSYMRAEIPAAFGLPFKDTVWQQGYVFEGGQIFLLVTLEKSGMPAEHRYRDRFLSRDLFEWKSQNRHTPSGSAGQTMRHHAEREIPVHLLVRKTGKIGSKAAPFIYCGDVEFVDWEGEKPITIRWRLQEPLPDRMAELFSVQGRAR